MVSITREERTTEEQIRAFESGLEQQVIEFKESNCELYFGDTKQEEIEGTLYLTQAEITWAATEKVIRIQYPSVVLHAVCRDLNAFPKPCLYCQLKGDDQEDVDEDATAPELRIAPANAARLQEMFSIFSKMAALHPDPEDDQQDDEETSTSDEEDVNTSILNGGMVTTSSADHTGDDTNIIRFTAEERAQMAAAGSMMNEQHVWNAPADMKFGADGWIYAEDLEGAMEDADETMTTSSPMEDTE